MKKHAIKNLMDQFEIDKLEHQEIIKGGPETSRGTETTVQEGGGNS